VLHSVRRFHADVGTFLCALETTTTHQPLSVLEAIGTSLPELSLYQASTNRRSTDQVTTPSITTTKVGRLHPRPYTPPSSFHRNFPHSTLCATPWTPSSPSPPLYPPTTIAAPHLAPLLPSSPTSKPPLSPSPPSTKPLPHHNLPPAPKATKMPWMTYSPSSTVRTWV